MSNFDPKVYIQMGYTETEVNQAYKITQKKGIDIFDALQLLQQDNHPKGSNARKNRGFLVPLSSINTRDYETMFSKLADKNSLMLKQEVREAKNPVGLLNVSNCCYLNSLLQCYFLMGDFVKELLTAQPLEELESLNDSRVKKKRIENEYRLLNILKDSFSKMAMSSRKYLDPEPVLRNLVDSVGERISYGEEKDLFEINMQIIERLNECLTHTKKYFRKVPADSEFNTIKRLFYGVKVEFLQQIETTSDFLGIIVNPIHQNLFRAIDQQFHYEVQIDGKTIPRHTYIRTQPEYLFFYINRMSYDRTDNLARKSDDKLAFEFQIYLDRYLERYKESEEVNSPAIEKLLKQKDATLKKLIHVDSLASKLAECRVHGVFFQELIAKLPTEQEVQQIKKKLKNDLEQIQNELKKIQSRKQKYQLIYIFVHRGDAHSGHYWGYGRNGDQWIRFDVNCNKMKQDQLEEEMDRSGGTPYALVYSKEAHIPKITYQHFLEPASQASDQNYLKLIPPEVQNQIAVENRILIDAAATRREQNAIQSTIRQYKTRYSVIKAAAEQSQMQNKLKLPFYNNFSMYLYSIGEKDLAKYNIFVLSLKSACKLSPSDLFQNEKLLKGIQQKFKKKVKGDMRLRHFAIENQPKQNQRYKEIYKSFIIDRHCLKLVGKICEKISKDQEIQTLEGFLKEIYPLVSENNSYVQNILSEIYTLIVFKVATKKPIESKYLEKFREKDRVIIDQVRNLEGITGQGEIFIDSDHPQPQVDQDSKHNLWKLQDVKKTKISAHLQLTIKDILEHLGEELILYKKIIKEGKSEIRRSNHSTKKTSTEQQKPARKTNSQNYQSETQKTEKSTQKVDKQQQKQQKGDKKVQQGSIGVQQVQQKLPELVTVQVVHSNHEQHSQIVEQPIMDQEKSNLKEESHQLGATKSTKNADLSDDLI